MLVDGEASGNKADKGKRKEKEVLGDKLDRGKGKEKEIRPERRPKFTDEQVARRDALREEKEREAGEATEEEARRAAEK